MRIAFTILLNGLNHLKHNNYYQTMIDNFDLWVIVEGIADNNGSTSWCRSIDDKFHINYLSNDGTTEFLDKLNSPKVKIIRNNNKAWKSKDDQVNAAILYIKTLTSSCYLWQVDIDEQWTNEQLTTAENQLTENQGKTGCFYCNFYVGRNQIVIGDWGEGKIEPYRRLWNWNGEEFITHEPPKLKGKNGPGLLLPQKFNHFSYYFEDDVKFKEKYYGNYDGIYLRWLNVQKNKKTVHVKELLGDKLWWSNTNTIIKYIDR